MRLAQGQQSIIQRVGLASGEHGKILVHLYDGTYIFRMAQVTVYLPQDVLDTARKLANEQNRSLSAWLSGLVRRETISEWPESLVDLLHHGSADLLEPEDPPPEDIEAYR